MGLRTGLAFFPDATDDRFAPAVRAIGFGGSLSGTAAHFINLRINRCPARLLADQREGSRLLLLPSLASSISAKLGHDAVGLEMDRVLNAGHVPLFDRALAHSAARSTRQRMKTINPIGADANVPSPSLSINAPTRLVAPVRTSLAANYPITLEHRKTLGLPSTERTLSTAGTECFGPRSDPGSAVTEVTNNRKLLRESGERCVGRDAQVSGRVLRNHLIMIVCERRQTNQRYRVHRD
jgi:hypothetical protein